jgi:predicted RNA-binding Zn ribbon-like protein
MGIAMADPVTEPTTEHTGEPATDSSRLPAPGRLLVVQDLINTLDVEAGEDELATPGAATSWLQVRGLLEPGEHLDDEGLRALVEVREALRDLACVNSGAELPTGALATLEHHSNASPVAVHIAGHSSHLAPTTPGVRGAIALLLAIVHDARVDGAWARLKCCRDDSCRWAFYDHSRNRSSAWCSMAVCGNRAKARAFRRRHHD